MNDDYDLIQDEREHHYRHRLQRRMASCGSSDYPQHLAQQDIIEAEQERLRIMGIVDISEKKMRCQECGEPSSEDNDYFKEWGTCNSYCYGKLVGVYS